MQMATGTLTSTAQSKLNEFRAEIDALDKQLIALLKTRIGVVGQVGKLKKSDNSLDCYIRSGREADMLRDIFAQFEGTAFHPEAAIAIWRQIIAASTQHELQMRLITPVRLQTAAKTYFGEFMPISYIEDAKEAITLLKTNPSGLIILPPWQEDSYFWQIFAAEAPETLKVFAILPFAGNHPKAFAAANLIPEASRDDISLFMDDSGSIEQIDGYHTEHPTKPHRRWLGIYARPLHKHEPQGA